MLFEMGLVANRNCWQVMMKHFPESYNNYFEPFTAAVPVFFRMRETRHGAFNAKLTDLNQELTQLLHTNSPTIWTNLLSI